MDDLKIYNIALTDEEVAESYNNSKPVIQIVSVTKEKAVVKNTIKTSGSGSVKSNDSNAKSVEVYSQGQKVLSNNTEEMNIHELPEGTYLLKITNYASKKITAK